MSKKEISRPSQLLISMTRRSKYMQDLPKIKSQFPFAFLCSSELLEVQGFGAFWSTIPNWDKIKMNWDKIKAARSCICCDLPLVFPWRYKGAGKQREDGKETRRSAQIRHPFGIFEFPVQFTAAPADPDSPAESWCGRRRWKRSSGGPAPAWPPESPATDIRSSDWN